MKLTPTDHAHLSVLAIKGDLTSESIDTLRQAVTERLQKQVHDFVVDLKESEFIDSKGLETLLWMQQMCDERLGQVRLSHACENVRTILNVTRLASRLACHEHTEAAIKSLRM